MSKQGRAAIVKRAKIRRIATNGMIRFRITSVDIGYGPMTSGAGFLLHQGMLMAPYGAAESVVDFTKVRPDAHDADEFYRP